MATDAAVALLVRNGCPRVRGFSLVDLAEGPCLLAAEFLDADGLRQLDATCRAIREINGSQGGSWCALGVRTYFGIELDGEGVFKPPEAEGSWRHMGVNWKGRFAHFQVAAKTFREPFHGAEITEVQQTDEIAFSCCTLQTDLLSSAPARDIYMEIEVLSNPDNVSLAVVDFEAGGCSSVTFSPDTGAVIRERKVCELPRKVQGAYIQPLATITAGRGFEGSMGIYLHGGQLAFFRRSAAAGEAGKELRGNWESTGFVTDLTWAEGRRLTPCLAFRNEGHYQVRMSYIGSSPPLVPDRMTTAYDESSWSSLNWDADQDMADM